MNSSHRIALRRAADPAFLRDYFRGIGLNICAGGSLVPADQHLFPAIIELIEWNVDMREPGEMDRAPSHVFDFVLSDCLGRFLNPHKVLAKWLAIVKPGGYLTLTLPTVAADSDRTAFTLARPDAASAEQVNVLDLVRDMSAVATCERLAVLREIGESVHSVEVVLCKLDVPEHAALYGEIDRAEDAAEAMRLCERALDLYPYRFATYLCVNGAMLRFEQGSKLESLWAGAVKRLHHERTPALFHALMLIAAGKINEGFRLREALMAGHGWPNRTTVRPPDYAPWRGESLEGKSIVIWSEFGLGDEIFFFRFARLFRECHHAAHVSVVCQKPLFHLFSNAGSGAAICSVDDAAQLPPHDYWVYPHAIPAYLTLDLDNLPDVVPYLRGPANVPVVVLPGNARALKVGVVFKGAPTHENDHARSLPSLACLEPLFSIEGVEFYIMQKGKGEDEAAKYSACLSNVYDLGPAIHSFDDTARCLDALDLLISVDTSTANLAGAMGRPVWLMLPMFGDWRWHLERDDSPWFPTARLFRERDRGWQEVVGWMRSSLMALRDGRSSGE